MMYFPVEQCFTIIIKFVKNIFVVNYYYHSMQLFLPFHWPRAHHVTCK